MGGAFLIPDMGASFSLVFLFFSSLSSLSCLGTAPVRKSFDNLKMTLSLSLSPSFSLRDVVSRES